MNKIFDRVTIVGIGLIGGSLGMAIKNKGLAQWVVGVDLEENILHSALEVEAIDQGTVDLMEGVAGADLVVLAAPVGTSIRLLELIAPYLKKGCIVTDVGSTKQALVERAQQLIPQGVFFIGGHPMAGSEKAGINGADLYLFENAVCILTVTSETEPNVLATLNALWTAVGSRVMEMDPEQHDFLVAGISHLPHIVAAALVNTVGRLQETHPSMLALAAGGFRDTTRIASGEPLMWRDICTTNKKQILSVLKAFKETLSEMEYRLTSCDAEGIERELILARETRKNIPVKMKGYLPVLYELIIFVPDRPGIIAEIAGFLGEAGININDIEIIRVKEGEGGSIRLGFGTSLDQVKAFEILKSKGIKAKFKV